MRKLTTYIKEGLFDSDNLDKLSKSMDFDIKITFDEIKLKIRKDVFLCNNTRLRYGVKSITTSDGIKVNLDNVYYGNGSISTKDYDLTGGLYIKLNDDINTLKSFFEHPINAYNDDLKTCVLNIKVIKPLDITKMFNGCSSLETLTILRKFKIENANRTFNECQHLIDIDGLDKLDFSDCETVYYMFNKCYELPDKVFKDFWNCNFDNISEFSGCTDECYKIETIDLRNFKNYINKEYNCALWPIVDLSNRYTLLKTIFLTKEQFDYCNENGILGKRDFEPYKKIIQIV
jgi:hypothetical protein